MLNLNMKGSNSWTEGHVCVYSIYIWTPLDPLPKSHPYTVWTPVRRASVLSPTRLCRASLRVVCNGVRVDLLSGMDRAPREVEDKEPGNSNWRVAAMWRSFS